MAYLAALVTAWLAAGVQPAPFVQASPQPTAVAANVLPPAAVDVGAATDQSARMSVPITISDRLWRFAIDTASTRSVIASDVAETMGLTKGDTLQILNIAGTDAVPSVIIPDIGFSGLMIRNVHAPSLLRSNLGGDGLLGLDILRNSRVSIDFAHNGAMTIAPSSRGQKLKHRAADENDIVVVGRSRMGELIVTDAEIDGTAVAVILDTGSETSIGNPALARRWRRRGRKSLTPITLLSVTGRTLPADFAVAGEMHIGGVTIANVQMAFADLATFKQFGLVRRPAILLGMQTLRSFARVTIDFPDREIRFLLPRDSLRRSEPRLIPALAGKMRGSGLRA